MKLFGEFTKIEALDDATIRVVGAASTGAVDEADETVLPSAMKAALPGYMRFGALREMHGLTAAGATLRAEVDDDGVTRIEAHVVDPVAVKKVRLGVYKGFSIGGKVLERDPGDRRVITKLKLNEISLVDRPCNPEAVIDMWKADAASSMPANAPSNAPSNAEVIAKAVEMAAAAGRPGRRADFLVKAREALLAERPPSETEDSVAFEDPPLALLPAPPLVKLGARNSAADLSRLQAAHDLLAQLGARCDSACDDDDQDDDADAPGADDAGGDPDDAPDDDLRAASEIARLERVVGDLRKRLDDLSAQPAPPRALAGPVRAVGKAEDANPGEASGLGPQDLKKYFDSLSDEERGRLQLMAALRQPILLRR